MNSWYSSQISFLKEDYYYSRFIGISKEKVCLLKNILKKECEEQLVRAEAEWKESKAYRLLEGYDNISMESVNSLDYKYFVKPEVKDFIAIVCDIRNSTQRLNDEDGIKRVFFETSALLPVIDETITFFGGKVTEYLGDGVLGFVQYDEDYKSEIAKKVSQLSKCCISLSLDVVHQALKEKYEDDSLELKIGVGVALSPALVRVVNDYHVKAFGQCVWRASKLSCGSNEILVDEEFKKIYGSESEFAEHSVANLKAFKLLTDDLD